MTQFVNLMPAEFQRRQLRRAILRRWSVVWIAGIATIVVVCLTVRHGAAQLERQVADLDHRSAPLRRMEAESVRMTRRLAEIDHRSQLLAEADGANAPLAMMGIISRGVEESGRRLQVREFVLSLEEDRDAASPPPRRTSSPSPPVSTAAAPLPSHRILTLTGIAIDDAAVARFIESLRSAGVFETVDLKSILESQHHEQTARKFELDCRIKGHVLWN